AIQPEITGRNPSKLTPEEGAIATQLGRGYIRQVKDSYPQFIEANEALERSFPHNIKAVNLYNLSDKYPSPSFIDAIHLNEAANQQVAEQLYYAIASFPKMQVKPPVVPQPTVEIKQ
ncbi:MAG: SGNH/GDSL hydrolase family protein, partial [Pleurocapsa sp.]